MRAAACRRPSASRGITAKVLTSRPAISPAPGAGSSGTRRARVCRAQAPLVDAHAAAKPDAERIPGLQEFAGSIWERRRRIPSQLYNDPLVRLFEEFDLNSDSRLTADEIAEALQSKRVNMTPKQVEVFIEAADADGNGTIEKSEFPDLIFAMATADRVRATRN